jgi:sugar phosphate isomerase/epimerase
MEDRAHPPVAVQLWTLRELAAVDLPGTLAHVAQIGFDGVELAGLHGLQAADVAETCASLGLTVCGAHVDADRFSADPGAVEAELRALGLTRISFATLPAAGADAVGRLALLAHEARERGLEPVFHNHDGELRRASDGSRAWEAIVAIPGLALEIDLGWAWVAGEDPVALVRSLPGRVPLVHVKDHVRTATGARDCPVGDGEVGYDVVLPAVVQAGVEWLVVEQDEPGDDPLGAARRSLEATRALLS